MAGCVNCPKRKADRYQGQTKFVPMPRGEFHFEEIAIDFVRESLDTETFQAILVVRDQFTKVQDYILARTTCTAEDFADYYVNDIWKLYNIPRYITSNLGMQFPLKLPLEWNGKLNINLGLSTT